MKTKEQIRKDIKSIFSNMNREELGEKNESIYKQITTYINTKKLKHICVYENMHDEASTALLISELEEKGYKVYTPQVISETEMIFIDREYEIYEDEIDLFIIPGRAFSKQGKRLGRGKGYYDRVLSTKLYKKSIKLGICYDFQVIQEIPTQKHDIDMDEVITNTNIFA